MVPLFILLLFFIIYFSFFYNKDKKIALPTDKLVADVQNNLEGYVKSKEFNDILDNKFQEKLDENKLIQEEKQETFIVDESQNEELNAENTILNSDEEEMVTEESITESKEKTKKNTKWNFFAKKSKKTDKNDEQTDIIEKNSDSSETEDKIQEEVASQQEKTQK